MTSIDSQPLDPYDVKIEEEFELMLQDGDANEELFCRYDGIPRVD